MQAKALLQRVLELKLQLTLCNPNQAAEILAAIDEAQANIQLITKLPIQKVIDVCNARYAEYVAEEYRSGKLRPIEQ